MAIIEGVQRLDHMIEGGVVGASLRPRLFDEIREQAFARAG